MIYPTNIIWMQYNYVMHCCYYAINNTYIYVPISLYEYYECINLYIYYYNSIIWNFERYLPTVGPVGCSVIYMFCSMGNFQHPARRGQTWRIFLLGAGQ